MEKYAFVEAPQPYLSWVGRISPEKGLEDCAAVSQILQLPVAVLGKMQDSDYWEQIQRNYPQAQLDYKGFLPTEELQQIVGQSRGALVTPKWVEAFGMVVLETLACGVPVVAYNRGGPAEIVVSGQSGWVVTPDSVSELVDAVRRLDEIDRRACRLRVEEEYSVEAMYLRFCDLTEGIVRRHGNRNTTIATHKAT